GSTLTVQALSSGYYLALVGNSTGWVPSQMAYLSAVSVSGRVPFSTINNSHAEADYQYGTCEPAPITNGMAQVVAGPELDQMQPFGAAAPVTNGYFSSVSRSVPTVQAGETVYYRVDVTYPSCWGGGNYVQPSTVLKLTAGGNGY